MAWWLGYAKAGKEFEVEQAARDMGIAVWVPRKLEAKRVGKKRKPQIIERPYIPNVVFLDATPSEFYDAQSIKFLASTLYALSRRDVEEMLTYRELIEVEQAAERRAIENNEALTEYVPGQDLRVLKGPFADFIARFQRVVENAHDLHPKYEVEVSVFGRQTMLQIDPLDVAAEG